MKIANNGVAKCYTAWMKYCLFALLSFNLLGLSHAQVSESEYTLGAGDLIKISVFGQSDLSLETRLSNVGYIRYPFLGDIGLVGKTVNEVEQLIDSGLRGDYLVNPSVSVTVEEYRPFFIDGEVKRPGGYPYQPGLNIDKAAALAGGYTERAAKGQVIIRRTIGGVEQNFEFNSNEIIMPGDIVTVKGRFF
ncbi:polysaccharide biosynthesis/export family protein [Glaciecola sp. 2405UD65-10]|uniref:polysaccharide biosynthesis/export family protein n=1 Tax=Glaciecola sp. 2405UD65-10 TaxID=3397244 RepID=UPI003B5B29A9